MAPSQYTVVTSDDFGEFEDQVNQLIGDGWELQGGVATSTLDENGGRAVRVQWSQAMVLRPRGESRVAELEEEIPLFEEDPFPDLAVPGAEVGAPKPQPRRRRPGPMTPPPAAP